MCSACAVILVKLVFLVAKQSRQKPKQRRTFSVSDMFRAYGTSPANTSTVNTEIVQPWGLPNYSPNQKKKGDYLFNNYRGYNRNIAATVIVLY